MAFLPFALFQSVTEKCLAEMGCLHIPTCWVPMASRMDACLSATTPAFLDAYLKGEVDRLAVVEHLATAPGSETASGWLPEFIKDLFRRS